MVCYRHIDGEREKGVRGMEKLRMKTESIVDSNVEKLKELFPNCVVEALDENGQGTKRVDFDLLKQELSKELIDENKERYQMIWPNKKQAVLKANTEIAKTLRPCREESEDYENTENIYIEGDNLDVLKVLRQTYMHKVKMIYIDPPYNTGNDFIYKDNYSKDREEYLEESGQVDEDGNRMFKNPESNGRFHTDWLNMIYPRLRVAKDLLTDDGVIFISIDDNEVHNLRKVCDEIFGESNFITKFIWEKTQHFGRQKLNVYSNADYILCYAKSLINKKIKELLVEFINNKLEDAPLFNASNKKNQLLFPAGTVKFNIKDGTYNKTTSDDYTLITPVTVKNSKNVNDFILEFRSRWSNDTIQNNIEQGSTFWIKTENFAIRAIYGAEKKSTVSPKQILFTNSKNEFCTKDRNGLKINTSENATSELNELLEEECFSYPKPVSLILYFINLLYNYQEEIHSNSFIVLDFFSGSGTSAHATLLANALDKGNRKFIMVQYPENLDDSLKKATKDNTRNIIENAIKLCNKLNKPHYLTEIGKERIRRAGKKIKEENANATNLDIGFRVFKLDSSNMKDCYYYPEDTTQDMLEKLQDNIKEDRTAEDLLIQVMLEMEVELSSKIETVEIEGKKVYKVNEKELVCCFERNLTNAIVTEIAKMQPKYAVFRDSSMQSDSVNINFEQLFKSYAPNTSRKVL